MRRVFAKRYPAYFGGFFLGILAVLFLLQIKRTLAPNFQPYELQAKEVNIGVGGHLRLRYPEEPGKYLVAGFPTQLFVAELQDNGRFKPFLHLEYRELTEPEILIGPLRNPGTYEIRGMFFVCLAPGDKECVRLNLIQSVRVLVGAEKEALLELDLKKIAEEQKNKGPDSNSHPIPSP